MLRVTSSFGVAQLTDGEGTSGLIARADAKLYEAKAAGAQPRGGVTDGPTPRKLPLHPAVPACGHARSVQSSGMSQFHNPIATLLHDRHIRLK